MVKQYQFQLRARRRGFHLITDDVLNQIGELPETGICNIFIKHTSAALTINENADPSVRVDFESYYNDIVDEGLPGLTHTIEGPDDMPAHIKSSITGSHISIPITNGRFNLGTWQGIYLCEFRNRANGRYLVITIYH
ncbi:secondary thiamine-phosphate synthase enzyme YjbQ [Portibacter marinus]|uniref:secondary thiamine-phosphate synthase enzyme YjbQ n=1 Tax=Portibacter marinus TaxID=2898660 RepID=UPI001F0104F7|nr:secondary thiamine-phosphate synthase enzyme YjbQ [Portibacter marinus]